MDSPSYPSLSFLHDRRNWAVVTGASSGIGEAFARRLALEGVNLVLVARRLERLQRLADSLPVETRVVAVDLADPAQRDRLWAEVEDLGERLTLLVNSAGFGLRGPFAELDRESQAEMVQVNATAIADLSHRFVNHRLPGGGGGLINVASTVGLRPSVWHATYGATKAFVVSLSLALGEEVRGAGLRVLVLCPGPVPTEFQEVASAPLRGYARPMVIPAEQVVEECLTALDRGEVLWVPGGRLRGLYRLFRMLPANIGTEIARRFGRP